MFDLAHVYLLYRRELRAALRERSIVVNSIVIPILLYPFMLWAMVAVLTLIEGQTEGFVSRIQVEAHGLSAHAVVRELERDERFEVVTQRWDDPVLALKRGQLDARLELQPGNGESAGASDSLQATLTFNGARERSRLAHQRLLEVLQGYRTKVLSRQATAAGITAASWQQFSVVIHNLASDKEMGAFFLGLVLPLFFVVMVAVGCFYPAVDATAGERERHTWETTLSLATGRVNVVAAKYLLVTSFGFLAGVLNLAAMTLSMGAIIRPLLGPEDADLTLTVSLASLPVLAGAALLLAAFVAAGMLLFASFARTFKEGQAMITPFYMLILLPAVFLSVPGIQLSLPLALIPVVNVALVIREAIGGTLTWAPTAVTVVSGATIIGLAVRAATLILRVEDVVMGSYGGSFGKFLRQRLWRQGRRAA